MTELLPEGTAAVFLTLCGATVVVVQGADFKPYPDRPGVPGFTWQCLGCGEGADTITARHVRRNDANSHAGQCRSTPLT